MCYNPNYALCKQLHDFQCDRVILEILIVLNEYVLLVTWSKLKNKFYSMMWPRERNGICMLFNTTVYPTSIILELFINIANKCTVILLSLWLS